MYKNQQNTDETNIKGLANDAQNLARTRTKLSFSNATNLRAYFINLSNLFQTPLIILVCINYQPSRLIPLYALKKKKSLLKSD